MESYILQHNLQPSILAWAHQVLLEGPVFRTLCRREQFVLILMYAYMKQLRGIDSVQQRAIFQCDQGVGRCPAGVGVAPCMCPNGKYWDSSCMRPLTAHEHAALQGIGEEERTIFGLSDIGEALLTDLAGNAFSGNVCVSMLLGALAAWKR